AGVDVVERLFLGGVALQCCDVAPGHQQLAALVIAYLADAARARLDLAVMAAGIAMHRPIGQFFVQFAFAHHRRDHVRDGYVPRNRWTEVIHQRGFGDAGPISPARDRFRWFGHTLHSFLQYVYTYFTPLYRRGNLPKYSW